MYTRADAVGWEQSTAFKKAFSIDVKIEILGVWFVVSITAKPSIELTFCF